MIVIFLLPYKIPVLLGRCLYPRTMLCMLFFHASSNKSTQYECSQAFHKLLGCVSDPAIQTQKTSESGRADFQLASPQGPLADKNSHRRLSLKNAAKNTWEITSGIVLLLCYFTSQLCLAWGTICCKFQRTQKQFT